MELGMFLSFFSLNPIMKGCQNAIQLISSKFAINIKFCSQFLIIFVIFLGFFFSKGLKNTSKLAFFLVDRLPLIFFTNLNVYLVKGNQLIIKKFIPPTKKFFFNFQFFRFSTFVEIRQKWSKKGLRRIEIPEIQNSERSQTFSFSKIQV